MRATRRPKHEFGTETLWLFLSCSHEARHLDDIIFAITVLKRKGVSASNVLVFVDHPTPEAHFDPYGITDVQPVSMFEKATAARGSFRNVLAVIGGHGDVVGVGSSPANTLSPTKVITAIRQVPGISVGVVLLTQCYAGVFNFLDANDAPPLVIVGATNLNPSVSSGIRLTSPVPTANGTPGLQEWGANIFGFHFFRWLDTPTDVDGDGEINLIDAYKFAGSLSNSHLRETKTALFAKAQQLRERQQLVRTTTKPPVIKKLELDSIELELRRVLDTLYLHQESWMLHAHLARQVFFRWPTRNK